MNFDSVSLETGDIMEYGYIENLVRARNDYRDKEEKLKRAEIEQMLELLDTRVDVLKALSYNIAFRILKELGANNYEGLYMIEFTERKKSAFLGRTIYTPKKEYACLVLNTNRDDISISLRSDGLFYVHNQETVKRFDFSDVDTVPYLIEAIEYTFPDILKEECYKLALDPTKLDVLWE